jgi:hypothetical protein
MLISGWLYQEEIYLGRFGSGGFGLASGMCGALAFDFGLGSG